MFDPPRPPACLCIELKVYEVSFTSMFVKIKAFFEIPHFQLTQKLRCPISYPYTYYIDLLICHIEFEALLPYMGVSHSPERWSKMAKKLKSLGHANGQVEAAVQGLKLCMAT